MFLFLFLVCAFFRISTGKDTKVSFPEGQIHEDLGLDPNLREFSKKILKEFSSLISGANLTAMKVLPLPK